MVGSGTRWIWAAVGIFAGVVLVSRTTLPWSLAAEHPSPAIHTLRDPDVVLADAGPTPIIRDSYKTTTPARNGNKPTAILSPPAIESDPFGAPDPKPQYVPGSAAAPSMPGKRAVVRIEMVPVTTLDPSGRQQTVMQPRQVVTFEDLDGAMPSEGAPADALSVVLHPRRVRLLEAFEQKLELLTAAEMDVELAALEGEIRELQAQTRMRKVREELADLQEQLPETAPAHAATQMLNVPVPRIMESKAWVESPSAEALGPRYHPQIPSLAPDVPGRSLRTPINALPTY